MGHAVLSVTSAAHSLPRHNVNTLICEASFGRFFEVTKTGEVVWEHVNPYFGKSFFAGPATTEGNLVFRALRYSEAEIAQARSRV